MLGKGSMKGRDLLASPIVWNLYVNKERIIVYNSLFLFKGHCSALTPHPCPPPSTYREDFIRSSENHPYNPGGCTVVGCLITKGGNIVSYAIQDTAIQDTVNLHLLS